jgi:predicted enzyme related to lactoylglutathione lyase
MSFRAGAGLNDLMNHPATNVVHVELHTPDLERARAFYRALCGWRDQPINTEHGSYLALALGDRVGGGIVECETKRSLWLPYVAVENVPEMTVRAAALGADVLLTPREGPAGWRSVIATPAGGELALWQQKR